MYNANIRQLCVNDTFQTLLCRRQNLAFVRYEDSEELARILTTAKIALLRAIKQQPGSITDIAARVHRDCSAVKRDIDDLEQAGLVSPTAI